MEIVAPAGNFEKLQYAIAYGADAVYLAGQNYGLRAFAGNFSTEELKRAVEYAHNQDRKAYLTINIFSLNEDVNALPEYLKEIKDIPFNAVIVSEQGTMSVIKKHTKFPIHLSTQANTTNWRAVKFWQDMGVNRVILAREVSYTGMLEISEKVPDIELETFIHGAMCMAWSGRCLMSALLNERSANLGECTHPCRWEWNLVEPTRPGQIFSVEEDARGTNLMHSKDLCLLREIPLLNTSKIAAGKIEGRMKSTYYTALMSRTYKEASLTADSKDSAWRLLADEISKVNHRPYFTGFFYGNDYDTYSAERPDFSLEEDRQPWQFCGRTTYAENGLLWFDCLSKLEKGDTIQIIYPDSKEDITLQTGSIYDADRNFVNMTKPNQSYSLEVMAESAEWGLVRKLERSTC